jgi:CheY-like chemotaxis protein
MRLPVGRQAHIVLSLRLLNRLLVPAWDADHVVEENKKPMMFSSSGHPILSIKDESSIASSLPATETEHPYILVVDDDRAILSTLMSLLKSEGYSCVCIAESQWVLPFLQEMGKRGEQHLPALLLLDLMMPVVSGYDIARWLSEHEPYNQIPILVITADARVHDKREVPGAQDILLKPFQIDALLTLVEHFLAPPLDKS